MISAGLPLIFDRYYKDVKGKQKSGLSMDEYTQTTGYFRCKHCHPAGNWEFPTDFMFEMTFMLFMRTVKMENQGFHFGPLGLFDGSRHRFATDAEEYLLKDACNSWLVKLIFIVCLKPLYMGLKTMGIAISGLDVWYTKVFPLDLTKIFVASFSKSGE